MTKYYAIKREIFKGNKSMPEETIIYPNIYKTLGEAVKVMFKDSDQDCLRYDYQPIIEQHQGWFDKAIETRHNSKTEKDTVYRHEWSVIEFKMEEA